MTFPTITTSAICEHCNGEGITTHEDSGHFDARAEQWYPTEATAPCRVCEGTGETTATFCLMCGQLEDDCTCDGDDLDAWNTFDAAA